MSDSPRAVFRCDASAALGGRHVFTVPVLPTVEKTFSRSVVLPDLPTVADYLPGFEASAFFGLGAPRGTPAEIVVRLNKEINMALSEPKIMLRFSGLGATVLPGTPADFGKLIADETEKWAKVIRAAGIKAG